MGNQSPNKPITIKVQQYNNGIRIIKKWCIPSALLFIWLSFLGFFLSLVGLLLIIYESESIFFFFFGILTVIASFLFSSYLLYLQGSLLINKTHIVIDKEFLTVRHKPLPGWGVIKVRVSVLEGFYYKKSSKSPQATGSQRGPDTERKCFDVYAKVKNSSDQILVQADHIKEALFIEKTLKDYLNVEDE